MLSRGYHARLCVVPVIESLQCKIDFVACAARIASTIDGGLKIGYRIGIQRDVFQAYS